MVAFPVALVAFCAKADGVVVVVIANDATAKPATNTTRKYTFFPLRLDIAQTYPH
jgi:hypothetical protein